MSFLAAAPFLFSAGGATAGAAAGAAASVATISGTTLLGGLFSGSALQVGGSLLGGLSQFMANSMATQIAKQNERIALENAQREADRVQQEQLDQDLAARLAMGQELAMQAASGFNLSSPSFALARKGTELIARSNAERLRIEGAATVENLLTMAADYKTQATQSRQAGLFGIVTSTLNLGSTLLTSGTTATQQKLQSLRVI